MLENPGALVIEFFFHHDRFLRGEILQHNPLSSAPPPKQNKIPLKTSVHFPITITICRGDRGYSGRFSDFRLCHFPYWTDHCVYTSFWKVNYLAIHTNNLIVLSTTTFSEMRFSQVWSCCPKMPAMGHFRTPPGHDRTCPTSQRKVLHKC